MRAPPPLSQRHRDNTHLHKGHKGKRSEVPVRHRKFDQLLPNVTEGFTPPPSPLTSITLATFGTRPLSSSISWGWISRIRFKWADNTPLFLTPPPNFSHLCAYSVSRWIVYLHLYSWHISAAGRDLPPPPHGTVRKKKGRRELKGNYVWSLLREQTQADKDLVMWWSHPTMHRYTGRQ